MAQGQGNYGDVAERIREETGADGVILFVLNGKKGNGVALVGADDFMPAVPDILRGMATELEKDLKEMNDGKEG